MRKIFVLFAAAAALTTAACTLSPASAKTPRPPARPSRTAPKAASADFGLSQTFRGPVARCGGAFSYARAKARLDSGNARQMASEDRWPKPPPGSRA